MPKCENPLHICLLGPDGQPTELDPCEYVDEEAYQNVTICITRCRNCGRTEILWKRQENTEEIDPDEF